MSNSAKSLAGRRAELVAQCAQQRESAAQEMAALRARFSLVGLRGALAANKTLALAAAGIGLGLVAVRPKRLLGLAAGGLSLVQAIRKLLPLLPR
jgi:hypothetical protein